MAIQSTTLSTTTQPIYTSVGTNAVVVAYFCNTSVNPVTISAHAVKSGLTANVSNIIYSNVNITAGDTYVVDQEKLILDDGDSLHAVASEADVVVVTVCNVEV
jgi:hypothetical protein